MCLLFSVVKRSCTSGNKIAFKPMDGFQSCDRQPNKRKMSLFPREIFCRPNWPFFLCFLQSIWRYDRKMFRRLDPKINPKGNSDLSKQKMLALGKLGAEKTRILISILSSNVLVQAIQ